MKDRFYKNKYDSILDAILQDNLQGVKFFLDIKDFKKDNFALRLAVTNNQLDVTKLLLENGYNINSMDNYCIKIAECNRNYEMMKLLFKHGACEDCVDTIEYLHNI